MTEGNEKSCQSCQAKTQKMMRHTSGSNGVRQHETQKKCYTWSAEEVKKKHLPSPYLHTFIWTKMDTTYDSMGAGKA